MIIDELKSQGYTNKEIKSALHDKEFIVKMGWTEKEVKAALKDLDGTESIRIPKELVDLVRKIAQEEKRTLVAQLSIIVKKGLGQIAPQ